MGLIELQQMKINQVRILKIETGKESLSLNSINTLCKLTTYFFEINGYKR